MITLARKLHSRTSSVQKLAATGIHTSKAYAIMSNKTIKRKYIRNFTTAKDFKNWVEKMKYNYQSALDLKTWEDAEYCLEKLHKEFGTVEPEKLVEIIYE